MSTDLSIFKQNYYSQSGEDGVLRELFRNIGVSAGSFCEFGAWDGQHLSNTFALYQTGWSGCYIEADPVKYEDLHRKFASAETITCICAFVEAHGRNSLEALLERAGLPSDLDLLSIDIDSDDLAIWRSLTTRPTVVVIEYNPTMPIDVAFENPPGTSIGNSARAIIDFANEHDYDPVAVTETNLLFLAAEANEGKFRIIDPTESDLSMGNRYFFGYDGTLVQMNLNSHEVRRDEIMRVPWSGALFAQPIKPRFRVYSKRARVRRAIGRGIAGAIVLFTSPWSFFTYQRTRRRRAASA